MDKKLEARIARLEKLLSKKNESVATDIIDQVAAHLKNALNAMNNLLVLQEEEGYTPDTIAETKRDIAAVTKIYRTYL
jgi:hypothetical protein